jgi:hypothetical protein
MCLNPLADGIRIEKSAKLCGRMLARRAAAVRAGARVLLIAAIVQTPPVVRAYEFDVHFTFTMFLAELAGFTEQEAFEIASHDQGIDDNPATQPMSDITSTGGDRRARYHFVSRLRQAELRTGASECAPPRPPSRWDRMGTFFHAFEDLFSHRNFGPAVGHLTAGHSPDKPWYDPGAFVQMAQGKFDELRAFRSFCGGSTDARAAQAAQAFAQAKGILEAWAQQEYQLGTVSDDQGPERWAELRKRLYGARLSAYTGQWVQSYRAWKEAQVRRSWREQ